MVRRLAPLALVTFAFTLPACQEERVIRGSSIEKQYGLNQWQNQRGGEAPSGTWGSSGSNSGTGIPSGWKGFRGY